MDSIGNMLSTIKNAYAVRKITVELPHSKMNLTILKILEKNGYVQSIRTFKEAQSGHMRLSVGLLYDEGGKPVLTQIKRVSKPGQRIYRGKGDLRDIHQGLGMSLVSTSRGVMSSREARARDLGGEVLCELW